jgi:hypothetical protein
MTKQIFQLGVEKLFLEHCWIKLLQDSLLNGKKLFLSSEAINDLECNFSDELDYEIRDFESVYF